jgi:hypothetical protein
MKPRRTILILIFFLFSFPISVNAESDLAVQNILARVDYFVSNDDYDLALDRLIKGWNESKSEEIINKWLENDIKLYSSLMVKNKKQLITYWKDPPKYNNFEDLLDKVGKLVRGYKKWDKRKEAFEYESNNPIAVPDIDDAMKALEKYEVLKKSQISLKVILSNLVISNDEMAHDSHYQIHKELVKSIQQSRCNYLSYDVVSPYLARTQQLVYLSEIGDSFYGPSKEPLREAAKMFVKGAYKTTVLDTHQDVRDYFVFVYSYFHEVAGEAVLKELGVFQSLQDSVRITPKNKLGVNRWFLPEAVKDKQWKGIGK